MRALLPLLFLAVNVLAAPAPLIPFRIGFVEGMPVNDPTLEKRRTSYEAAVYFAMGENSRELEACGYRFQHNIMFFDSADRFAPKERTSQLEAEKTWFIVGPGRSDHFLMAAMGVSRTPLISPSASSNAVHRLPPPIFTAYPPPESFAGAVYKAVRKEKFGPTYGSLVDVTCSICKDFSNAFDQVAAVKLQKKFSLEVASDRPDLLPLISAIQSSKIDFLVLPNFGGLSGFVVANLQGRFPNLKFVGSHSWGDGANSFTEEFPILPTVGGLGVRIGSSPEKTDEYYQLYSLNRDNKGATEPLSAGTYNLVQIVRKVTDELCELSKKQKRKLTTKESVYEFFKGFDRDRFRPHDLLGIWRLKDSKYSFFYEEPK